MAAPTAASLVTEGLAKARIVGPSSAMTTRATDEWLPETLREIADGHPKGASHWRILRRTMTSTTPTVSGTKRYALPADSAGLTGLGVKSGTRYWDLSPRDEDYFERLTDRDRTGESRYYRWPAPDIELYPVPNGAWTLVLRDVVDISQATDATLLSTIYRTWRNAILWGIAYRAASGKENLLFTEFKTYFGEAVAILARDDIHFATDPPTFIDYYGMEPAAL